jgi:hypothetical protein
MSADISSPDWLEHLKQRTERAQKLGFDGYCTDCDSATFLTNGRCGCGSGRVVTPVSLARPTQEPQHE